MAGKVYDGIEEFYAAVEAMLPEAMEKDVAPFVEDILSDHIESDIYDVYTPHPDGWVGGTYRRRHVLEKGIVSTIRDSYLSTTSTASPRASITGAPTWGSDEGAFFDLLASDDLGLWVGGFPRPAVDKAQAEVDGRMTEIENLLLKGLDDMLG